MYMITVNGTPVFTELTEAKAEKICEEWGWTYDDTNIHGAMIIEKETYKPKNATLITLI